MEAPSSSSSRSPTPSSTTCSSDDEYVWEVPAQRRGHGKPSFSSSSSRGHGHDHSTGRSRAKTTGSPLDVSASLFVENNKLLDSLAEEVRRLRSENAGLDMTVESLAEENDAMNGHLASIGARVQQFQCEFDALSSANKALLEERNLYKINLDAANLKIAETETALQLQRKQYVANVDEMNARVASWETSMRRDEQRRQQEHEAMRLYIERLEKECSEQNRCRIKEVVELRETAAKMASLEELLRIEQDKASQLLVDCSAAQKEATQARAYTLDLLDALRIYEVVAKNLDV